eukprot:Skav202210  [mRNA]  locus=scaffold5327:62591:67683:- [translate_table: standard]
MSIELEHAIGCNVEFKRICHIHPNGRDYLKAVGGVVIVGDLKDPHAQVFCQGHDDFVTCAFCSAVDPLPGLSQRAVLCHGAAGRQCRRDPLELLGAATVAAAPL